MVPIESQRVEIERINWTFALISHGLHYPESRTVMEFDTGGSRRWRSQIATVKLFRATDRRDQAGAYRVILWSLLPALPG